MPRTSSSPPVGALWQRALDLAAIQDGVVSRRQLRDLGVPRWLVTAHLRARRIQRLGSQSLVLHNGPLSDAALGWGGVFEGGPRAHLDGESALVAGGLERWTTRAIRVSVPRGARRSRVRPGGRWDVRQTRRWSADDLAASGVPRTRPEVAAVRAALWARTDKQATYVLTLTVQQGLATPEQLGEQALRIRRDRRRLLVHVVVNDLLDGGRSLGELDVVRELRRRGLPAPAQQVVRKDGRGRYFLDLYWPDLGVVVEIDGIHHGWATNVVGDALRQNALTLAHDVVLRLPLLGLRLQPDEFFAQIEAALDRRDAA